MSVFIAWFGVMFPLVFSPGPANIVFAMSGAKVGIKRSLPLLLGVDLVFVLKSIVIGFGLGEVVNSQPELMNIMQLLGAVYLLYLAAKFFFAHTKEADNDSNFTMGFVNGLVIQLLNSKGWLMVFLMFTLFSEQANQTFANTGVLVLILWLAVLNISVHLMWVAVGGLLARISTNKIYERSLNIFYSTCLALVSIRLISDNPLLASFVSV